MAIDDLRPLPVERTADAEALRHGIFIVRALAVGPGDVAPDSGGEFESGD